MRVTAAKNASQEIWNHALDQLRKYGENSMCYLDLEADKTWYFSESVAGFAGCAVSGHGLVVCGDPVYESLHMAFYKIGEEATFDVPNWSRLAVKWQK